MRYLVFVLITVIVGCAAPAPPTYEVRAVWDQAHAERLMAPGLNTIKGDGFIRQQNGGVVTCAGETVLLLPATAYAAERIQALYRSTERGWNVSRIYRFVPDPPDYLRLSRETRCNSQGNFEFTKIADGEFFVVTAVRWQAGDHPQGGMLMHRARVQGGETEILVMTN